VTKDDFIDISLPLSANLPAWPGSPKVQVQRRLDMAKGDTCNESILSLGAHSGTHVDAPLHFIEDGADVTQLPIDAMVGPATVAFLPELPWIDGPDLEKLALPAGTERLLLRTQTSDLWSMGKSEYWTDFVALTLDAACWVVARGIRLVGIDSLSIQRHQDGPETHRVLLEAGVVVIEGLNLYGVAAGHYELLCLPLNIQGAEGAPARVVLRAPRERT
jgi:arylformamidase